MLDFHKLFSILCFSYYSPSSCRLLTCLSQLFFTCTFCIFPHSLSTSKHLQCTFLIYLFLSFSTCPNHPFEYVLHYFIHSTTLKYSLQHTTGSFINTFYFVCISSCPLCTCKKVYLHVGSHCLLIQCFDYSLQIIAY